MNHLPLLCTLRMSRSFVSALLCIVTTAIFAQAAHADVVPKIPDIKPDAALAAMVPKSYRDKGMLTVAVNPDVAPIKFVDDDGNIVGFTPDLLSAAAALLDVKLRFAQASFDALIPGMNANRFDVLLSLSDFESRHKVVTFVDYLNMGETIVAKPDTRISLKSLDDLCGLQAGVLRGTAAARESGEVNERCMKSGKKALNVSTYPDANMALLSLSTGASDVAWVDSPVGYYNAAKFPAKYKVIFFSPIAPYGIGFGVDEKGKQLANAVQQALIRLQKVGVYDILLKKWHLSPKDGKPQFPINGAQL